LKEKAKKTNEDVKIHSSVLRNVFEINKKPELQLKAFSNWFCL